VALAAELIICAGTQASIRALGLLTCCRSAVRGGPWYECVAWHMRRATHLEEWRYRFYFYERAALRPIVGIWKTCAAKASSSCETRWDRLPSARPTLATRGFHESAGAIALGAPFLYRLQFNCAPVICPFARQIARQCGRDMAVLPFLKALGFQLALAGWSRFR